MVALVVFGLMSAGCSDSDSSPATTTTDPPSTTTEPSTTTSGPPSTTTTLPADAASVIPTTVAANSAIVAGGALWVAGTEDPDKTGADTLLRLDPATGEVTSRIDVGGFPLLLVAVDDGLWVATSEGLARVAMETESVETVDLGGAGRAMTASEETVWVEVSREGELDTEITAVDAASLDDRPISVADTLSASVLDMATDGETVWMSVDDGVSQTVLALDAATDEPVETFEDPWTDDPAQAVELELVDEELWICDRTLSCVVADPTTGDVLREASLTYPEGELTGLVYGSGSLWASIAVGLDDGEDGDVADDRTSTFLRVDPTTGAVLGPLYDAAYPVPELAVGDDTAFLVASANESRRERELVRIDLG